MSGDYNGWCDDRWPMVSFFIAPRHPTAYFDQKHPVAEMQTRQENQEVSSSLHLKKK
jgi:hypothetical protein